MFEYFKGNYTWNLSAVSLVEQVGTISEPAEAFAAVASVADAAPEVANEALHEAMVRLGDRLRRMAEEDEAAKHPLSAARKHHCAAMYLMLAERVLSHLDPRRLATYRRSLDHFSRARNLGGDGVEFVDIPYKDGFMPALLIPAEKGKATPLVVHLQGFDSVKETRFPALLEYRRRGLSCLIVDQPGAGGALRLHGLHAEVETEHYVAAIVDWVMARSDIAADRIGLAGISMGGYFAPRAAAFEPRIKACAAWGAFFDFDPILGDGAAGLDPEAASVPSPANHAVWAFGVDTREAFVAEARKMTLAGVVERIKCPLLVMHGENDRQVPVQQAIDMYEAATTKDKTLKIFTADEGGVEHCQADNQGLAVDYLGDWFSEKLADHHPAAASGLRLTGRETTMPTNEAEKRNRTLERTRSYLDLMRAQRWDEWIALWADDAVLEFPFAPEGRQSVFRGKKAILEYMSASTEILSVDSVAHLEMFPMLDPEAVTVELEIEGHLLSNGAPYNQRYVTLFQFKDGKIQHYREYWNPLVSVKAYGGYDAWMSGAGARRRAGGRGLPGRGGHPDASRGGRRR